MAKTQINLVGQKFGRWTVLERLPNRKKPSGGVDIMYLCQCECGKKKEVYQYTLLSGKSQSCGCLIGDVAKKNRKKNNIYDLTNEYGIGYTEDRKIKFYFDLEDYDKIKDYYWNSIENGYIATDTYNNTTKRKKKILLHRLIFGKLSNKICVDHINHINYDNRKCNLRLSTNQENCRNISVAKNNKSSVTGVYWAKDRNKWVATIKVNYKDIYLGRYNNFEDAVKARKQAEEKYFGEFSYDNSMKIAQNNNI